MPQEFSHSGDSYHTICLHTFSSLGVPHRYLVLTAACRFLLTFDGCVPAGNPNPKRSRFLHGEGTLLPHFRYGKCGAPLTFGPRESRRERSLFPSLLSTLPPHTLYFMSSTRRACGSLSSSLQVSLAEGGTVREGELEREEVNRRQEGSEQAREEHACVRVMRRGNEESSRGGRKQ